MAIRYLTLAMPLIKNNAFMTVYLMLALALTGNVFAYQQATQKLLTATDTFSHTPFVAIYDGYAGGKKMGKATRTLKQASDNRFDFEFESKLKLLFFSDKRRERASFSWINNTVVPISYQYRRSGTGSNRDFEIAFDNKNDTLITSKMTAKENRSERFDNQSFYFSFKAALANGAKTAQYKVINQKGAVRDYDLKVIELQHITLPIGTLEAYKVEIKSSNVNRKTHAWFAPSLDYTLVKLIKFKHQKQEGKVELRHFSRPQKSVITAKQQQAVTP